MSEGNISLEQVEKLSESYAVALRRAQAEFLEMPGLQLTEAQAARLWAFDWRSAAPCCRSWLRRSSWSAPAGTCSRALRQHGSLFRRA